MYILPTIRINEGQYRGKLSYAEVLRALCAGFNKNDEPAACNKVGEADCRVGAPGDVDCKNRCGWPGPRPARCQPLASCRAACLSARHPHFRRSFCSCNCARYWKDNCRFQGASADAGRTGRRCARTPLRGTCAPAAPASFPTWTPKTRRRCAVAPVPLLPASGALLPNAENRLDVGLPVAASLRTCRASFTNHACLENSGASAKWCAHLHA